MEEYNVSDVNEGEIYSTIMNLWSIYDNMIINFF